MEVVGVEEDRVLGDLTPQLSHYDRLYSPHELSVSDYNELGLLSHRSGHGFDNYLVHRNET